MKRIVLCADDYGQTSAISQAIIELLRNNRLSATSCMTTSPFWLDHANWLRPLNHVDIGLHFNLTEGQPLTQEMAREGFFTLKQILLKTHLNQINKSAITIELHAQIDQFHKGMGRLPDYIDGHQHVHHMPVIRDMVINAFKDRLQAQGAYIRSVFDPHIRIGKDYVKRLLIQNSGATSFKKQLLRNKIPHNSSFSGIYAFSRSNQYRDLFNEFLRKITHNGLIMCHPGLASDSDDDGIRAARLDEYRYLKSDQFVEDCIINEISLGRFG